MRKPTLFIFLTLVPSFTFAMEEKVCQRMLTEQAKDYVGRQFAMESTNEALTIKIQEQAEEIKVLKKELKIKGGG